MLNEYGLSIRGLSENQNINNPELNTIFMTPSTANSVSTRPSITLGGYYTMDSYGSKIPVTPTEYKLIQQGNSNLALGEQTQLGRYNLYDKFGSYFGVDGKTVGQVGSGLSSLAGIITGGLNAYANYKSYKLAKKNLENEMRIKNEQWDMAKQDREDFYNRRKQFENHFYGRGDMKGSTADLSAGPITNSEVKNQNAV